jgi:nucleoside 2-deoxyribosyltransferase
MTRVFLSVSEKSQLLSKRLLENLLSETGLSVLEPRQNWFAGPSTERERLRTMEDADLVIVILDRDSAQVLFEMGYAVARRIPIVVLVQDYLAVPNFLADHAVFLDISHTTREDDLRYVLSALKDTLITSVRKNHFFPWSVKDSPDWDREQLELVREQIARCEHLARPEQMLRSDHLARSASNLEEQVTAWLVSQGGEVRKAPRSHIDDYDLLVQDFKGRGLVVVQIKAYSQKRKVSVGQVQQLEDAMRISNAESGILVTDSDFTASARDFAANSSSSIELLTTRDLQAVPAE